MLKKNNNLTNALYGMAICAGITFSFAPTATYAAPNAETLSGVKTKMNREQRLQLARNKKLAELQAELEQQEKTISKLASDMREVKTTLEAINGNIQKIERDTLKLEGLKKIQIKNLKELLNSQYRQGRHSGLSALLSGQGTDLDRMTVYVEHLSKARSKAIGELEATSTELQLQHRIQDEQREQKLSMLEKLNQDKQALETTQQVQQQTAQKIQQQIKNSESYLAELKENEIRLTRALERARRAQQERELKEQQEIQLAKLEKIKQEKASQAKPQAKPIEVAPVINMSGIGKSRGKLNWPVQGKLLHKFGSQQSGQLRWQGVVISAKAGTEVEAVHDGTVVLSNWLRGYGLMMVIDHGKGDMSFYGYNQTLLRKVGDKVKAGETIALVGSSGGRTSSGLYFEIRRKGSAINPSPWLIR